VNTKDRINSPTAEHAPWDKPWLENELEILSVCPVCASPERKKLYDGLVDNVFYCAPGEWTSWRCAQCGCAYLDPRPSPASIHLAYGNYYTHQDAGPGKADYADLSPLRKLRRRLVNGYINWRYSAQEAPASPIGGVALWAAWPFRIALDREYRHLPRRAAGGGALLDIGCGNGSFLRIARSCGWDVTGLDPDPKAVANCSGQGWPVLEGGVEQLDGKEAMFDVITMSHVIEHVHDPVAVMRICHRLLKPGGRLWLETPNIDSQVHRQYGRNWRGLEPPRHLVLFNRRSLLMALSAAGFARIERAPGPSPLSSMTKASEALKLRRSIDDDIQLDCPQKWLLQKNGLLQAINPGKREFLTFVASKN